MRAKNPSPLQQLAELLTNRPQDFATPQATDAVAWLIEHACWANWAAIRNYRHRICWERLPENARRLASRRQVAALAARTAMRGGMKQGAAIVWVIAIANMSQFDFQRACAAALRDGDRLYVWQWRELRKLELRNDFMSRRQIELWLENEEPWLFDECWVFPLHLVDKDVLVQFDPEKDDAAE